MNDVARVENYRNKAEEVRTVAEGLIDPAAKAMLLEVAQDYLHMANTLEGMIAARLQLKAKR